MSLLIATPMYGGQCTAAYCRSAISLKEALIQGGMEHDWLTNWNDSLITRVRDVIAADFLQNTDYKKLLFIDADIEFSPEDVALLWNLDTHVSCGAYRLKQPDSPLGVWRGGQLRDLEEFTDPVSVDFAGTGFMMIDREAFEALKPHVPEYEEGRVGKCWAFFQDPVVDLGQGNYHESEDYHFCRLWRERGGEVICHPGIDLTHWGQMGY